MRSLCGQNGRLIPQSRSDLVPRSAWNAILDAPRPGIRITANEAVATSSLCGQNGRLIPQSRSHQAVATFPPSQYQFESTSKSVRIIAPKFILHPSAFILHPPAFIP